MNGHRRGFTLIELMIVVAILGILAAVAIPSYLNYIKMAKKNAAMANYETAVRVIKGEFSRHAAGGTLTSDVVALLNQNASGSPYNSNTPAYLVGAAVNPGQVAITVTDLESMASGTRLTVRGEWSGGHTADGVSTILKE